MLDAQLVSLQASLAGQPEGREVAQIDLVSAILFARPALQSSDGVFQRGAVVRYVSSFPPLRSFFNRLIAVVMASASLQSVGGK
jgi:hypothetical protein